MDNGTKYGSMYQVSTLQALAQGYIRPVVTVGELIEHGNTGLGTFEGVNGEMIVIDGICYRALSDGTVELPSADDGVPFASLAYLEGDMYFDLEHVASIEELKDILNLRIEEGFGLNSMHVARIDGTFEKVFARSESASQTQHVTLKDLLSTTQREFSYTNIKGTLICVYYPAYMDGINAAGWHLHFISEDRSVGGHVFNLSLEVGQVCLDKISRLEIQLPREAAFDVYMLNEASQEEIKEVEQGQG